MQNHEKSRPMHMKSQSSSSKTLLVELALHSIFYAVRFILYFILRTVSLTIKLTADKTILTVGNIIIGYMFSQFLLFFVIWCILVENMYGYCLSAAVMLHNFLVTIITTVQVQDNGPAATKYQLISILISVSYVAELCFAMLLICKKCSKSSRSVAKKTTVDPKIKEMIMVRQNLKTLAYINIFVSLVMAKKLHLPSFETQHGIVYGTIAVIGLTLLQCLLAYVRFHDENLVQRKIAIVTTVLKLSFTVGLLISTVYCTSHEARVINIVIYTDALLVTLASLCYLWVDMESFGNGLRAYISLKAQGPGAKR